MWTVLWAVIVLAGAEPKAALVEQSKPSFTTEKECTAYAEENEDATRFKLAVHLEIDPATIVGIKGACHIDGQPV